MKTMLWVMLFLCTSVLSAEVLFYDNFNRANCAVGNSWTNIGSATSTSKAMARIENIEQSNLAKSPKGELKCLYLNRN